MAKSSGRRTRDPWNIGMIVVGVAAIVFAGYAASVSLSRDETTTPSASAYVPPVETPIADRPMLAFLGDSYTAGAGASDAGRSYASLTGRALCWRHKEFGQGGTGYSNPGQPEQNEAVYSERISDVVAVAPSVVIIQGSTNDKDDAATYAGASSTFAKLRAELPAATIVALGPLDPPDAVPSEIEAARSGVSRAANEAGVPFIDPVQEAWIGKEPSDFWADGYHPSNAGHTVMADRLKGVLPAITTLSGC